MHTINACISISINSLLHFKKVIKKSFSTYRPYFFKRCNRKQDFFFALEFKHLLA